MFHHFPKRPHEPSRVHVNITSILDIVKKDQLETGAWINVVGYVAPSSTVPAKNPPHRVLELPTIQAIMLWSADSINLGEYEKALIERQKVTS